MHLAAIVSLPAGNWVMCRWFPSYLETNGSISSSVTTSNVTSVSLIGWLGKVHQGCVGQKGTTNIPCVLSWIHFLTILWIVLNGGKAYTKASLLQSYMKLSIYTAPGSGRQDQYFCTWQFNLESKQVNFRFAEMLTENFKDVFPEGPFHFVTRSSGCFICFYINPLPAKFFRGNINIYLHFMSFLHIHLTQVLKILPQVREGPTHSI